MAATTVLQDCQQTDLPNILGHLGNFPITDPYQMVDYSLARPSRDEMDAVSLQKLRSTGLDLETLNDSLPRYKIAPLRHVSSIWEILGYDSNPGGTRNPRYSERQLTTLAFGYPNQARRGEIYDPSYFVRVRFSSPLVSYGTQNGRDTVTYQRYAQCVKKSGENSTHSEPYFLPIAESWERLYDPKQPLWITEGELKSISLTLAGCAAIGFGGATMWSAPSKAGKHRIHPALDPKGPRATTAIPLHGRQIYLVPDIDIRSNLMVRKSFMALAYALFAAGTLPPCMVMIPPSRNAGEWKGIDDYLHALCGPAWSGNPEQSEHARQLVAELVTTYTETIRLNDVRYKATSAVRGADRLLEKLQQDNRYAVKLIDRANQSSLGWAIYDGQKYSVADVYQTLGSTSGKMVVMDQKLRELATAEYEIGVDIAMEEGADEPPPEMPADYPNRVLNLVDLRLPVYANETLMLPFDTVAADDQLLRLTDGLLNLTAFLRLDETERWAERRRWYLPPNHRWVGTGCLQTGFSKCLEEPTCPLFLAMLNHATNNDPTKVRALQLYLAKTFCNPFFTGIQQFLALYGQPGSGKGTVCRVVLDIIGEHGAVELRAQMSGRFETANLPGKRLVLFHETPDSGRTGSFSPYMADLVKSITGQDRIPCERKGHNIQSHYVNAEVMIIGETPPTLQMHADAFKRRAVFVGFTKAIERIDYTVEERIRRNELPGIVWWALQAVPQLQDHKRIESPITSHEDIADLELDVSPVDRFITECIARDPTPDARISFRAIRDRFDQYVVEHNLPRSSAGAAGRRLSFAIRTKFGVSSVPRKNPKTEVNERCYLGLKLVDPTY